MILKRYGSTFHSVALNFDSKALNEIGFRRDRELSVAADDFEARFTRLEGHELTAQADGRVQDHTEQELLDQLQAQVLKILAGMADDQVLVFENEEGRDYPKTRQKTHNVIEHGENVLHFTYTVSPPLRFGVYRNGAATP
jgi:hypothetical protein